MVEQADGVLAMDFQNKAELLTRIRSRKKRFSGLSAYAEGPWQYRKIPDPYLGDLDTTRFCAMQLRTCVHNLTASTVLSSAGKEQVVGKL